MQVKQAVAGYGGAQKKQVMLMTQRLLKMKSIPRPDAVLQQARAGPVRLDEAEADGGNAGIDA